jgi:pimeloyl-ACP methyl ester carboxylesterase
MEETGVPKGDVIAQKMVTHPWPTAHWKGTRQVVVSSAGAQLPALLAMPAQPSGLVVFAHGSGNSRHSPSNRAVAKHLVQGGLATLLFDLLSEDEDRPNGQMRSKRFDIELLTARLIGAIDWLATQEPLAQLPLGLFGSSTGSAACLRAAAARPQRVRAIVSRGGRPDLAFDVLAAVRSPTLLIVGSHDVDVLELNAWAASRLQTSHAINVVAGAGHLFEEPGCLEEAARLAREWFQTQL